MSDDSKGWKHPAVLAAIVSGFFALAIALVPFLAGRNTNAEDASSGGAPAAGGVSGQVTPGSVKISLSLLPELSGHVWQYPTGAQQRLNTYFDVYKVGIAHTEDMPPAGESVAVFSFDLSPLAGPVSKAVLNLNPDNVTGVPFERLGAMIVEEVIAGDLKSGFENQPVHIVQRFTAAPAAPVDITLRINNALTRGLNRYQVRVKFANVYLPSVEAAIAASDTYVSWNTGATLEVAP